MRLTVEPDVVALSPGDVVDLVVRVANDGAEVCTPHLAARGVDPSDVLLPSEVVAVAPGEVMTAIVRVRAAADATPGDQRIAVAVEDLEGQQRPVSATTLLRVGARPDVAVQVEPVATAGRTRARATTILRNRSDRRLQVDLVASAEGVDVRFRPARVALDPGETRRVRTRIRRTDRSWFAEIRHGAVVTARGIGAPASTTLTFTQRPAVPRLAVRGLAAFMALAVWVAATAVVFQRINAEDPVADGGATVVAPAAPGPGRTSATGMFVEEEPDGVRLPIVIQGTIEGPRDPAGTLVTAERISFGDQGTTTGVTKVVALTPVKLPRGAVLDKVQVTTDERGRFRIASGLVADSFYRVTAVRNGFEVGSFIVSTSQDAPEVTLAFALDPAPGVMEGRVVSADGTSIGGATVLVTDGTLTYTTTTASEGLAAGTWTIEGVATPTTYQVVVTRLGFASETLIVEIEGGQRLRGVDATLTADLGTLRGTVRAVDPASGQTAGVGGIDITLAGPEARTTRTVTAPANLRGVFTFPALPYGTYELTFSAPGWSTRVTEVTVDRGDVVLDVSDLVRASGVIQGHVWQVATGPDGDASDVSECRYPRLRQRDLLTTIGRPCGGVSVSVTDEDGNVFATASANSTGFFQVDGVPAGAYMIRLARAGYVDHVERRVLAPGGLVDITPDHTVESPAPIVLALSPALAACLGTVELTVVQRGSLDPVEFGSDDLEEPASLIAPRSTAAGIRFPVKDPDDPDSRDYDFTCESGQDVPQWRRLANNVYLVENVPLGQTPLVVDFEGFAPTERTLAVSAGGLTKAVVQVATQPRDITGTIRIVSGGAAAARDGIRVRLLDSLGTEVPGKTVTVAVTTPVDGGHSEATFTIPRADVDETYSLAFDRPVGPGVFAGVVAAQTTTFPLPAGGEPFVVARQDLVARTLVTGTVRGFAASASAVDPADLTGAKLTFTPEGGGAATEITPAGASFSVDLPAGRYTVTVEAAGHVTRTFASASTALIGTAASSTQQLQPTTAPYAEYPAIAGAAGEVGLIPAARAVRVDVTLVGAEGASRDARVELVGGTIGGVATTTPTHSQTRAIVVGAPTASGRFTFAGVPAGVYTLNVVPTDAAGAGASAIGIQHTGQSVVVGPDGAVAQLDVTTSAQAMSRITGRVVGFDVFTLTLEPLEAATVTPPAGSGTAATTGADGAFDLVVRSGAYGTGAGQDFAAITVTPAAADLRYDPRTFTGTVSDVGPGPLPGVTGSLFLLYPALTGGTGDVGLDATPRPVSLGVDLLGVAGSTTRDLTIRLVPDERTFGSPATVSAVEFAFAQTVASGTVRTFGGSVRPGTHRVDVSAAAGTTRVLLEALSVTSDAGAARVRQVEGEFFVDIQPGTTTVALSATVRARTVVTGTVFGFDADLDPVALSGASITFPASARATTTAGEAPAAAARIVNPGADGTFTVEVDAGSYVAAADRITLVAPGYQQRSLVPVLAAGTGTLLTGAAAPDDVPFPPNGALAGVTAAAGDVVLTPLARAVTVDLTLLGAPGASRDVTVALTGGILGGASTTPDAVTANGSPVTLTVGTTTTVTLSTVPVGAYTLEVAGAAENQVIALSPSVTVIPDAVTPTTALALTTTPTPLEVQALTALTVTVTGVQVDGSTEALTAGTAPLGGATVTVPAAGGLGVVTGTTDTDGVATLVVASGAYNAGAGQLGPIALSRAGYVTTERDATIVAATETVTIQIAAADTLFTGTVVLAGAAGATRTLTVDVCESAGCGTVLETFTVTGVEVGGEPGAFTASAALPVGVYTFRVTGDGVEATSVTRVIGPATGEYPTTAIEVNATVTLSGTVVEDATTGSTARTIDSTLPLGGVTVTPASGVPSDGDASVTTASDGTFSIELLSGRSVELTFARSDFALGPQTVSVGDGPAQTAGPFTMARGAGGIRIEGSVSDNVTGVIARATGHADVVVTPSGPNGSKRYALDGLATAVEWTIEFTTDDGVTVRRYVASADALAVKMDQDARIENVGTITVDIAVGQDPSGAANQTRQVRVTLSEVVPSAFFSLSPSGSVESLVTVEATGDDIDSLMIGTATFSGVPVAASSPSLPAARFTIVVEVLAGGTVDTAYRWTTDPIAPGSATLSGVDLLAGSGGMSPSATRTFTFVRSPAQVTGLTATVQDPSNDVGSGEVKLDWTAPSGDGGGTIEYVVEYSSVPAGDRLTATCSPTPTTTPFCAVSGLVNGTPYDFFVTARSASFQDLAAAPVMITATPRTVPDAPTITSVTPGDGTLTVSWTAPATNGGSEITSYTVTATPTSGTPVVVVVDPPAISVVVGGLTNGTVYTVTVTATNGAGTGAASTGVTGTPAAEPEPDP